MNESQKSAATRNVHAMIYEPQFSKSLSPEMEQTVPCRGFTHNKRAALSNRDKRGSRHSFPETEGAACRACVAPVIYMR